MVLGQCCLQGTTDRPERGWEGEGDRQVSTEGPDAAPSPLRSFFILLTLAIPLREVGQWASAGHRALGTAIWRLPWSRSEPCPRAGTGIVLLELLRNVALPCSKGRQALGSSERGSLQ